MPGTGGGGAWTPCPCCESYLCRIHGMHAYECPCPPVEEWDTDPYQETAMDAQAWRYGADEVRAEAERFVFGTGWAPSMIVEHKPDGTVDIKTAGHGL